MEENQDKTKFCKYCAQKIPEEAVICMHCGRQVENLKNEQPSVVINNANNNTNVNKNTNMYGRKVREKNKWIALLLCIFLGWLGAHKFYEEKIIFGLVYLFTFGFFGIGIFIDFWVILFKPNPYYI